MQQYYEIPTQKGIMRGFFHIPQKAKFPVCLIFHGFTGCKTGTKFSYVQLSRMLEDQGIGTIRMDFLGSGESDLSFKDMTFDDELSCARLILEEALRMETTTEVYLLGHSMGGAIASELAKLYPQDIQKMCLWAPAFNLSEAVEYLKGDMPEAQYYDHSGFEISHKFVGDLTSRNFYQGLDTYQNALMILHGTQDKTVPYSISERYLQAFHNPMFYPIDNATHNYDQLDHIQQVIRLTYEFMTDTLKK